MKEKKGFTLVELLAVITLLSLVGLISVPIATNIIDKSKVKAYKQTLNGIIDAAKIHNAEVDYQLFADGDIDLTEGKIQFENLDTTKYKALASNAESTKVDVVVKGVSTLLNKLNVKDITAYVDLSDLSEGKHEVPVMVKGKDLKLSYTSRTIKIEVIIAKK